MREDLDYIDSYFNGLLSPEENQKFDQRIKDDPDFAREAAFYYNALKAAGAAQAEQKKQFRQWYEAGESPARQAPVRRLRPWLLAAAALLLLAFGWYLLARTASPQQLADQYIKDHLSNLPVSMGSGENALQAGLRDYNNGQYRQALDGFEQALKTDSANAELLKAAGIVSLRLPDYDKALGYFLRLEENPRLFSNPGKFFHALTLIKRNRPGDSGLARDLLKQVVAENLEESQNAAVLLKGF
jgi:tetratricopeptide (TPR) repeat protein